MNVIYTGSQAGPINRLGRHQFRMLEFALLYPGWHSLKRGDRAALSAMRALERRKVLEVAWYDGNATPQFRFNDSRAVAR